MTISQVFRYVLEVTVTQVIPFFGVTNMERSVKFYTDGLGFVMKNHWMPDGKLRWCWLDLGAASVMLQEFREGKRPEGTLGAGMSVCFNCDDAVGYYRELLSRGIAASEPFVGNNLWVTGVADPDGYKLFFNSATDVPEETKLSEGAG